MIGTAVIVAAAKTACGFVFDTGKGKAAAVIALGLAVIGWFAWDQQSAGALKYAAKAGAQNNAAHAIGAEGARNSNRVKSGGSGGSARGVLDPTTRLDP